MARPKKKGLDYFPLDVDFFDDPKIAAISGEFGAKGELVALRLLCAIYRNGYFAEWSDMLKMKLVRDVRGVSEGLLEEIVKRLVRWEFFDKGLFDSLSILTSRGIQKRYFSVARRRVSVAEIRYLLVSVDINDSKTEFLHTETGLMSTETPQRKENKSICIANTKESKREKSDEAAGASSSSRNVDARDTSSQSLEEKSKSCAKRTETFFTEVM